MNETNAGFGTEVDQGVSERPSDVVRILLGQFGHLKRIIAGMGLSASDAEDVLQDVAIQALKQPGKWRSEEEGVRWLIKVTVNGCLMEHRRRRSFRRRASEIMKRWSETRGGSKGPGEKAIAAEELEMVREGLRELDGSLLTPMVLRYFCDLSSTEIGQMLELKPATVRSRLREARMTLAERLIERGVGP